MIYRQISIERCGAVLCVRLRQRWPGEVDLEALGEELNHLLTAHGCCKLALSLRGLDAVCSTLLGKLIATRRRLQRNRPLSRRNPHGCCFRQVQSFREDVRVGDVIEMSDECHARNTQGRDADLVGLRPNLRSVQPIVEPDTSPDDAVITGWPGETPYALPLLTVASEVNDDVHVAKAVKSCVVLSEKVPIAVS